MLGFLPLRPARFVRLPVTRAISVETRAPASANASAFPAAPHRIVKAS
ncbi:hypothetical protein CSX11_19860 [Mycobacterium goodii]|nr:hypothetical protein CSX11_19860 [Mycolicibacterium goodii]